VVNSERHDVFSGPAFPFDQNGHFGRRHLEYRLENFLDGRGAPHDTHLSFKSSNGKTMCHYAQQRLFVQRALVVIIHPLALVFQQDFIRLGPPDDHDLDAWVPLPRLLGQRDIVGSSGHFIEQQKLEVIGLRRKDSCRLLEDHDLPVVASLEPVQGMA
jgi:hypothetical protein